MLGFVEWLLMMLIMAVVFFAVLWFVMRSAVRSGMRAAHEDDRDARLADRCMLRTAQEASHQLVPHSERSPRVRPFATRPSNTAASVLRPASI